MPELRLKGVSSPSGKMTAAPNAVQDSFMKLDQAEQLRQQRKFDRAQAICESLVRQYPDYMGALHTLGLVYADKGNYQRALDNLVRAAMLNPRSWNTLTALSGVYLRLDAKEMAAQALEQARALKPNDPNVLVTLAEIYREEREYELAKDAYRQAFALEENLVPAAMGLGWMCAYLGQNADAAQVFEGLLNRGLRSLDVLHALTSLPAALVSIDTLKEMDRLVRDPQEDKSSFETMAAFVRAAALDKAGRHTEAWEHLDRANRAVFASKREELDDAARRQQASLRRVREHSLRVAHGPGGDEQIISLFILGPSRSGKTTMEQLIATIGSVKRGCENPIVENAVRCTFQTAALLTSNHIEDLPAQLHGPCREIYLEELARRAGSASVFTNTHPARIHDVDRMVAVLPNLRFIFVKRKVEDTLLRTYMRHYTRGNAYSYNLDAAREHVVWYHNMMDVLAEKLPNIVRIVHYEDMVADPAAALRIAAELCGITPSEAALSPIGDDRGCAEPYREFITAEFRS